MTCFIRCYPAFPPRGLRQNWVMSVKTWTRGTWLISTVRIVGRSITEPNHTWGQVLASHVRCSHVRFSLHKQNHTTPAHIILLQNHSIKSHKNLHTQMPYRTSHPAQTHNKSTPTLHVLQQHTPVEIPVRRATRRTRIKCGIELNRDDLTKFNPVWLFYKFRITMQKYQTPNPSSWSSDSSRTSFLCKPSMCFLRFPWFDMIQIIPYSRIKDRTRCERVGF